MTDESEAPMFATLLIGSENKSYILGTDREFIAKMSYDNNPVIKMVPESELIRVKGLLRSAYGFVKEHEDEGCNKALVINIEETLGIEATNGK